MLMPGSGLHGDVVGMRLVLKCNHRGAQNLQVARYDPSGDDCRHSLATILGEALQSTRQQCAHGDSQKTN